MFPQILTDGPHRIEQTVNLSQQIMQVTEFTDSGVVVAILPVTYEAKSEPVSPELKEIPALPRKV